MEGKVECRTIAVLFHIISFVCISCKPLNIYQKTVVVLIFCLQRKSTNTFCSIRITCIRWPDIEIYVYRHNKEQIWALNWIRWKTSFYFYFLFLILYSLFGKQKYKLFVFNYKNMKLDGKCYCNSIRRK